MSEHCLTHSSRNLSDVYILLEILRQSPSVYFTFKHFHWEPFNAKNFHKIHVKIKTFFKPQDNLELDMY